MWPASDESLSIVGIDFCVSALMERVRDVRARRKESVNGRFVSRSLVQNSQTERVQPAHLRIRRRFNRRKRPPTLSAAETKKVQSSDDETGSKDGSFVFSSLTQCHVQFHLYTYTCASMWRSAREEAQWTECSSSFIWYLKPQSSSSRCHYLFYLYSLCVIDISSAAGVTTRFPPRWILKFL